MTSSLALFSYLTCYQKNMKINCKKNHYIYCVEFRKYVSDGKNTIDPMHFFSLVHSEICRKKLKNQLYILHNQQKLLFFNLIKKKIIPHLFVV